MTHHWVEDNLTPRVDVLVRDFTITDEVLPVAHPEWFRVGDIVRVGADDLEDTGEIDAWGNPVLRARNEAVQVLEAESMGVLRGVGVNPPQGKSAGDRVVIIACAA